MANSSSIIYENGDHRSEVSDWKSDVLLDDYYFVGWDIDVTGRRLLDEIFHLAAYTSDDCFSRYIMPCGYLSDKATSFHMIRMHTIGSYRIMEDVTTNKILKSEKEIPALQSFLDWLEDLYKSKGKSGVLLICYEPYQFNTCLFIKMLEEYNFLERFQSIVKGFIDCRALTTETMKSAVTIRGLSNLVLGVDDIDISKANYRARLVYEIVEELCAGNSDINSADAWATNTFTLSLLPFTRSIDEERNALCEMRRRINLQDTLKPIFGHYIRYANSVNDRKNVLNLRKYLTDASIDYDMLKRCWLRTDKYGIRKLLRRKMKSVACKDVRKRLFELITEHFEEIPFAPLSKSPSQSDQKSSSEFNENL